MIPRLQADIWCGAQEEDNVSNKRTHVSLLLKFFYYFPLSL